MLINNGLMLMFLMLNSEYYLFLCLFSDLKLSYHRLHCMEY